MTQAILPLDAILQGHTQSLFQALRLLQQHAAAPTSSATTLNQQQLLDSLRDSDIDHRDQLLLSGYLKHQHPNALLSSDIRPALIFVDLLISQLLAVASLHSTIVTPAKRLSAVLIARLLSRPDIIINTEHPLCQFNEQLFQHLAIWEPHAGKAGRQMPQWLNDLTSELFTLDINSSSTVKQLSTTLQGIVNQEQRHSQKLEQRLQEASLGDSKTDAMRQTVMDFMARRLSRQPMPEDIVGFVQTRLIGDLQYLLIHEGVECPIWKKWQRLLQVLSWAFAQHDNSTHRNKVMTLLPPLIEQLDESYWQAFPKPQGYETFFESLQYYFLDIIKGTPLTCEVFPVMTPVEPANTTTIIDQSMLDHINRVSLGEWFSVSLDNEQTAKGKLTLKDPKNNLVILTRYSGKKLVEYRFEDFSLALASKIIRPLGIRNLYQRSLKGTLYQLDKKHQHHLKIEQRIAQTQAKDIAAAKAREEALSLNQRQTQPRSYAVTHSKRESLRTEIAKLHVGAWLEIRHQQGETKHIKLSVKLESSDKYIFTDRLGQRAADHCIAELIDLMAKGQLAILSQGEHFENSLEKVVRGLRRPAS